MFTNLPHGAILNNVTRTLKLCFKNANRNLLPLILSIKSTTAITLVLFILELIIFKNQCIVLSTYNSFCTIGDVFKKKHGVPQGGNFSPLLADLTMPYFEHIFVLLILKNTPFYLSSWYMLYFHCSQHP